MQGEELKAIRQEIGWRQHEMATELGMTTTFIGMMERGERPIEARTALAARQLFNEDLVGWGGDDEDAREGDIPIDRAQIIWNCDDKRKPPVLVVGIPGNMDDDDYLSSTGACDQDWNRADNVGRVLMLLRRFVDLTVREGYKPKQVHRAFSVIPEYRAAMLPWFREVED